MNKLPVYCDFEYLQNFFSKVSSINFNPLDDVNEIIGMLESQKLFLSRSILLIDKTEEEIKELSQTDDLIKVLVKKSQTGGSELYGCKNEIEEIKSGNIKKTLENDPFAIYCLNVESDFSADFQSKFGSFCYYKHDYPKIKKYRKEPEVINIGSEFNWASVLPSDLPSRFIIIHDNYLLENTTEDKSENLKQIISALFNKEYLGCFEIHFFHFIEDLHLLDRKKSLIIKLIEAITLPHKVTVNFIKGTKENLHDRDILTNFYWVHCGHTTDIVKKGRSTKRTTIHFNNIFESTNSFLKYHSGMNKLIPKSN